MYEMGHFHLSYRYPSIQAKYIVTVYFCSVPWQPNLPCCDTVMDTIYIIPPQAGASEEV